MYSRFFKRALDIGIALPALLVLSPVFAVIALLCMINNGGKIFFLQPRAGYRERAFTVIKFRTMNDRKGPDGELLPDDQRLTTLGNVLRKTSLDELPQLLNVLAGHMSIIGPRPLLLEYLPYYNETERRRHWVRPGITGWAQVNGRNVIGWKEKFAYDVWYVDNLSLALDLKILYITIKKVVTTQDVITVSSGRFRGSNEISSPEK